MKKDPEAKAGAEAERARAVLGNLKASLGRTDPLVAGSPGVRDVVNLLRWHGEAERELGKLRAKKPSRLARELEGGLIHAFLVLSRPALHTGARLFTDGLAAVRRIVVRNRYFLVLALMVWVAAFGVGFFAMDAESRFGDLLLLESKGGRNLATTYDPVGALMLVGLGAKRGAAFLGEMWRILLLYGLFTGGLFLGIPPALALAVQGARFGSIASTGAFATSKGASALYAGVPDVLATVFVCAAGFVVAYRFLATGNLTRWRSAARGLRDGVALFGCGLVMHLPMLLPVDFERAVLALAMFLVLTVPVLDRSRSEAPTSSSPIQEVSS